MSVEQTTERAVAALSKSLTSVKLIRPNHAKFIYATYVISLSLFEIFQVHHQFSLTFTSYSLLLCLKANNLVIFSLCVKY